MKNLEIAKILYDIADILEMQSVQFKPVAYRKAARSIESLHGGIDKIYQEGGIKALEEIPGVGRHIAAKVETIIKTGKLPYYEKIKKDIPPGLLELMNVPGIGPKKAMFLYKKLGISSAKALEEAVKQHKVKGLSGFGEKSEENIVKGVELYKKKKERIWLGVAYPVAKVVEEKLKQLSFVKQASIAGSLARMKETIGDIDILASSEQPGKVMDFFTAMPDVKRVLAKGLTKSSILLTSDLQIDLRVVDPDSYGSALQYFVGSKEHNIALRKIAIGKGYKLSEYGLFNKDGKQVAGRTEQEIYKKLGLQWPEPELRENNGEIQAAIKHQLPKLVQIKDIKGDLHVHTTCSDGLNTIEEMAAAAKKLGYEYIAISDHAHLPQFKKIKVKEYPEYIKAIEEAQQKVKGIRIIKAIEVDIATDGSLDLPMKVLRQFDIVSAGIHHYSNETKKQNTERLLKAISHDCVKIIAHPAGRVFGKHNAMEVDWDKIFEAAKKNNIALEVNSMIKRLDLPDTIARSAKDAGVTLVIGTDAHSTAHLDFIKFGVATARRAWCTKQDILNTLTYSELIKRLVIRKQPKLLN